MTGRILIIDTVPTNRIVLKVKMLAAKFKVDACASKAEAEQCIAQNCPDLILINLSDPVEDRHAFCQSLKSDPSTASIAIISVGVADTARARFAALDAGADDVLPRPINDSLLLARIRSLLRVRYAREEMRLRDGTSRALGFEDSRTDFQNIGKIAILSADLKRANMIRLRLTSSLEHPIKLMDFDEALGVDIAPELDLFVIDATAKVAELQEIYHLISDLRTRSESRHSTILVLLPEGRQDAAAMCLDLGADNAVASEISDAEIVLRSRALMRQKILHDTLREGLRDGLQAAVTDSLTGLFNRRYLDSHLARMADQALQSQQEFAGMMIDIDHFKAINDGFGHAAGDQVLRQFANRLRENLRAIDLVARVGGEEFLIAMPSTTKEVAYAAADRLRSLIANVPFNIGENGDQQRVTISIGVSVGGSNLSQVKTVPKMCDAADAALYAAKSAGRDRVLMGSAA